MREATLAASLFIDFLGYLERKGFRPADVCRDARIDSSLVDAPQARLPASWMERLWITAERLTGDPDIGMHTAESYNPGALSIFGYVILSCATAAEVLDKLSRYAPLLNEALRVTVTRASAMTTCRLDIAEGLESFLLRTPRQSIEAMIAGIVITLQRMTTSDVKPASVRFRHAAPASTTEHARILGPVAFAQPDDVVVYPTAALGARILSADLSLLQMFELDAQRRLEQLESHGTVSGRVLTVIADRLKGEVPALADVASTLAMSERSIQRSLRDENTSYRQLIDEVRKDLALQHLARPGTSAADVAFLLGFSEPSAFTRAFRRWTGSAPTHFRIA